MEGTDFLNNIKCKLGKLSILSSLTFQRWPYSGTFQNGIEG